MRIADILICPHSFRCYCVFLLYLSISINHHSYMKFDIAPMSRIEAAIASLSLSVIFLSTVFISGNMPKHANVSFNSSAQLAQVCSASSIAAGTCGNFVYSQTTGSSSAIPPGPIIGYMGAIIVPCPAGAYCPSNLSLGTFEMPIYKVYNQVQTFAAYQHLNYVRMTTNDTVQIICPTYSGLIFTGPGTFTPTANDINKCQEISLGGNPIFTRNSITLVAPAPKPAPTISSISPTSAIPGASITISGSNFTSTDNSISLSKTGTTSVIVNNIASAGSSLTFSLPQNIQSGSYNVSVTSNGKSSNSVSLSVVPSAPSDLMTILTSEGKVKLSWKFSLPNSGFELEAATDTSKGTFAPLGSTEANVLSYLHDTDKVPMTTSQTSYRVRARLVGGGYSDYSNISTIANCLKISGDGPIKVVFMSGRSSQATLSQRLGIINYVINKGFKVIEPYKSNISRFSFYSDIADWEDDVWVPALNIVNQTETTNNKRKVLNMIASQSSCANSSEYLFFANINDPNYPVDDGLIGYTAPLSKMAVISTRMPPDFTLTDFTITVIHEFTHAFAGLVDEYYQVGSKIPYEVFNEVEKDEYLGKNCALASDKETFWSSIDNRVYGADIQGCKAEMAETAPLRITTDNDGTTHKIRTYDVIYRPSTDSLMNNKHNPQMNVISCGYAMAAINGEPADKAHAQTHWPECMRMPDTIKEGILPISPTPTSLKISNTALTPGDPVINGYGFSPTGNSVLLTSSLTGSTTAILDIPSPDGKSISFIIPTSTPSGSYSLRVGAFNSPWSAAINVTVYPKIDFSSVSCMAVSGVDSSGTRVIPGYRFYGSPAGGLQPLSYTLNNMPVTNSTVNANGVNILSYMSGGVWTPNVFVAVPNARLASGAELKVVSKDGQIATTTCAEIAPTTPTSEPTGPTIQTPMVTAPPTASPMTVRTAKVAAPTVVTAPSSVPAAASATTASTTLASAPQAVTPAVIPVTIITSSALATPTAPISETFTLNVDYSHFAFEESQNHYASVYSSVGTKSTAITVFKFTDSSTMTADQVKTKLAALGYRPATLDEMYALGQAGKWNIIGLGTSMGSYNMYPVTVNAAQNGLFSVSSTALYSTQTYRFAAVKLAGAVSMNGGIEASSFTASLWDALSSILYAWKR